MASISGFVPGVQHPQSCYRSDRQTASDLQQNRPKQSTETKVFRVNHIDKQKMNRGSPIWRKSFAKEVRCNPRHIRLSTNIVTYRNHNMRGLKPPSTWSSHLFSHFAPSRFTNKQPICEGPDFNGNTSAKESGLNRTQAEQVYTILIAACVQKHCNGMFFQFHNFTLEANRFLQKSVLGPCHRG